MRFEIVRWEQLSDDDRKWLEPMPGVDKPNFREMQQKLVDGEWWIFRLPWPAQGLAVGFPDEGRLFIYYLRGYQLFSTVTSEDLLAAARAVNLHGMRAETRKLGVLKLLLNKGFRLTKITDGPIYGVELDNVRR